LSALYWFTVEFGLCREGEQVKAYGAGILSSFGELQYSVGLNATEKPKYLSFDAKLASESDYPITTYQPTYFVAESFVSAKEKIMEWIGQLKRPFGIRYNPFTQSVEILDSPKKLVNVVKSLQNELSSLQTALNCLEN